MTKQQSSAPRIKPIITYDDATLETAMLDLWGRVHQRGLAPDGIIGIASGGLRCAEKLRRSTEVPILSCAMRRPGTRTKARGVIPRMLAALPYGASNWARRIEDGILARRADHAPSSLATEQLRDDVSDITREVTAGRLRHLVVIDDAVDSGATLSCVMQTLRAALPFGTLLTTAVITKTRSQAAHEPDVILHRNTLCRFPWSFDFRGA